MSHIAVRGVIYMVCGSLFWATHDGERETSLQAKSEEQVRN